MFFVGKPGGKQRLVVDCRRSNHHFTEPARVSLATGDAIGRLQSGSDGGKLVIGQVDIKDAFYRMALPLPLRGYFGLRPLAARYLALDSLDGCRIGPDTIVRPRMRCLPMGWS